MPCCHGHECFNPLQGRNAEEQVQMIQQIATYNSALPSSQRITVSVEIEKTREPLYQLFPHGDVVRGHAGYTTTCLLIVSQFQVCICNRSGLSSRH